MAKKTEDTGFLGQLNRGELPTQEYYLSCTRCGMAMGMLTLTYIGVRHHFDPEATCIECARAALLGPPPDEEQSKEAWEAAWDESIRLAREYGWPESAIESILLSRRVSYEERMASVERAKKLWIAGNYGEALIEEKRTKLKRPAEPLPVRTRTRTRKSSASRRTQ